MALVLSRDSFGQDQADQQIVRLTPFHQSSLSVARCNTCAFRSFGRLDVRPMTTLAEEMEDTTASMDLAAFPLDLGSFAPTRLRNSVLSIINLRQRKLQEVL